MRRATRGGQRGQAALLVVVLVPGLLALIGIGIDSGRAVTAEVRAMDAARDAARAGASELIVSGYTGGGAVGLDPTAAQRSASALLAADGATGEVQVAGDEVGATARVTIPSLTGWLPGLSSWTMSAHAVASAERGVVTVR